MNQNPAKRLHTSYLITNASERGLVVRYEYGRGSIPPQTKIFIAHPKFLDFQGITWNGSTLSGYTGDSLPSKQIIMISLAQHTNRKELQKQEVL